MCKKYLTLLWLSNFQSITLKFLADLPLNANRTNRLADPMNHSTAGLFVHHQPLEFTQTHAHPVGDAIQPSHPLLSPSPPAPNPSQYQGLFQ